MECLVFWSLMNEGKNSQMESTTDLTGFWFWNNTNQFRCWLSICNNPTCFSLLFGFYNRTLTKTTLGRKWFIGLQVIVHHQEKSREEPGAKNWNRDQGGTQQGNHKLKVIFEYIENSMLKLLFPDISDNLKISDKVAQIAITAKLIKPDCAHSPVCWGQSPGNL